MFTYRVYVCVCVYTQGTKVGCSVRWIINQNQYLSLLNTWRIQDFYHKVSSYNMFFKKCLV